ncbi:MAG TPA: glycosyltransferase family 2 protein [Puia sp.]|jgi:dolichol-phosphate mannosyltransferase|nr:glycosyltransferase family 2 protein [Puia sp.]
MPYKFVLAVVIPVYNEAQNLAGLLGDWQPILRATGVPYKVILIDDGSRDNSLQLLRAMAVEDPALEVHTQRNGGHGAAVLHGYRLAQDAEWVFQIDSDHQLETTAFVRLWANREDYDLLIAQRRDKNASTGRRWVSRISTILVRLLYGKGVTDVNSPYRLMRCGLLRSALDRISAKSFAPNILLTSWFILGKRRIFTTVVEPRKQGLRQSRFNRYFLIGAIRSTIQTILFRIR